MTERVAEELGLLERRFPALEFVEPGLWCRIPDYIVPGEHFKESQVDVAFQIPANIPGQEPYGLWVKPGLTPSAEGAVITNYTYPAATGFGNGWGQFSWAPDGWHPGPSAATGDNMITWVSTFAHRFLEGP
jgi:hypothetical protein